MNLTSESRRARMVLVSDVCGVSSPAKSKAERTEITT